MGYMRVSIGKVLGGLLVFAMIEGCGGKSHSSGPQAAGAAGAVGAGAGAGTGGQPNGSEAGEGGAPIESGGSPGAGGSPSRAGSGGADFYPPIEIGAQQTSDKLDVLFVVDNSASMGEKQKILNLSLSSFVGRLVNPWCVDPRGKPVAAQPESGEAACLTGKRELKPVKDLHLGVISTSIGGHGGAVCSTSTSTEDHLDDRAELLPAQRANVPSYNGTGYVSYDAAGVAGVSDVARVISDLQAIVTSAGERGCGYEAPLEAMYRFLVDPEPPVSVTQTNGQSTPNGINQALLDQRKAFLRPDSAVAIVIVSDENDCSIRDDSVGWFVGANARMPLSTAACDADVNDPCCRSCAQSQSAAPPAGCPAIIDDVNCKNVPAGSQFATWDPLHDSLNLRCFEQKRRFGFDLLYPLERYSDALSNPKVKNRNKDLVDNPLLAARDGMGPRSATLVSVSVIVGAPWQDLATTASSSANHTIEYLDGEDLESNARWPLLVGDRAKNVPPSDPFMIESIAERSGKNPLTQTPIVASTSTNPLANAINGHEQSIPSFDDLQYACTFPLLAPKPCPNNDSTCDCAPDKTGSAEPVQASNSPLCQPPTGGAATTTQYYGKGYPGTRELGFARLLGARAVPASICPTNLSDASSPDYAYNPAFSALLARLARTLE